jgi:hypothetical protein
MKKLEDNSKICIKSYSKEKNMVQSVLINNENIIEIL